MHLVLQSPHYSIAHDISHVRSDNFLIHSHPFYELWYFISGDVHFLYAGTEYEMRPDTLIINVPNIFHGIQTLSTEPYERFALHFTEDVISLDRRNLLMGSLPTEQSVRDNNSPIPYIIPDAGSLGLRPLLQEFDELQRVPQAQQPPLVSVLLEGVLSRLLLHAGGMAAAGTVRPYHSGQRELDPVLTYIHQNLTEKLTLDDLSERFYLSKSKLNSLFRQQTGTTAMDYIILRRLSYAQQLLINGCPASQAGTAAGFGDYTAFYRAYVKQMGHSPKLDKRDIPGNDKKPPAANAALSVHGAVFTAIRDDKNLTIWNTNKVTNASEHDPGILRDP